MILGIGVDIVRVDRFDKWGEFSQDRLVKIFSDQELEDCKKDNGYCSAKLAARFAAKEAIFKALSASLVKMGMTDREFSLLFLCRCVDVVSGTWEVPTLKINWKKIGEKIDKNVLKNNFTCELSLSHEREFAIAYVVLSGDIL